MAQANRLIRKTKWLLSSALLSGQCLAAPAFVADPSSFINTEFLASRALLDIKAQYAYARGFTGKGVILAIVDSGLDINHPEFLGRISALSRSFANASAPNDLSDVEKDGSIDGHGTHVTGLAGAARDGSGIHGVAFDATLLALRAVGFENQAENRAILHAIESGAQVLNGSYGPGTVEKFITDDYGNRIANPDWAELKEPFLLADVAIPEYNALKRAADADIVLVYAAGNEYTDQPIASLLPSGVGLYPLITPANTASGLYKFIENDPNANEQDPSTWTYIDPTDSRIKDLDFSALKGAVIAVVSVDREGKIASYSNRCGAAADWCLAAPGGDFYNTANYTSDVSQLWSTYPYGGYANMAGTSMASPVAAGATTILRSAFPYMTARQIIEVILTTANSTGVWGNTAIYGHGMLDLDTATKGPKVFGEPGFPDTFDVNTRGYDSHWSNNISGTGGLIKRGAGTLTLWGDNTYGTTRVAGGKLVINGNSSAAGKVTVDAPGILGGTGTLSDLDLYGRLEPGNSIGTLTVSGNYQQFAGSVLRIEINDQGQSDRVVVMGNADIQGGALQIDGLTAGALGKDYNFFSAGTITAGSAFDTTSLGRAFIDLNTTLAGTAFTLQVRRNASRFAQVADTGNQRATANAIETQGLGGTVHDAFVLLDTAANGQGVLDELSGEIHASMQSALLNNSSIFYRAAADRLWQRTAWPVQATKASGSPRAQASGHIGANSAPGQRQSWIQGIGRWGHLGGTANAASAQQSLGGLMFGADTHLGNHHYAGVAIGLTNETLRTTGSARARTDGYHLMGYSGWSFGNLNLRSGVGHTWYSTSTNRNIAFGDLGRARAASRAQSTQLFVEAGYALGDAALQLEPYLGLQHVWLSRSAFNEDDSRAALNVARSSQHVTLSNLGIRTQWALHDTPKFNVAGTLNMAWRRAWGDTEPASIQRFATGPAFTVSGASLGRNVMVSELGLTFTGAHGSVLSLGYSGQFGSGNQQHGFAARAQWRF
ncbi:autotransporter domain-containing protein [Pusillimonas sp. NJUB218]|uniref:autotransporter domain-containing protein n=1 Tax=Pusillimonas sp. NJUB218 TaxID=2023230 RepID=UPI000F4B537C|nr:autotransporter serine protease [Pusillimonas sp. NJUB218]ROT44699.1 hypothetical protein CHR62_11810 [Pusillimonas sp. NJUB218]